MQSYRTVFVCLAAAALLVPALSASPAGDRGPAQATMSGAGQVNATDDFGGYFPNAGQFEVNATQRPDGSAAGTMLFVGKGEFAAAWGACPYDPRCEPDTNTKTFQLRGDVTGISGSGESVEIVGTLTETDHGLTGGVIFEEFDVPFVITADEGSNSFVLQFCFVPPFTMDLARGKLSVTAGGQLRDLLRRPTPQVSARPCHGPESR